MVNVSGSTMVITVSRCISARVSGHAQRDDPVHLAAREQPPGEPLDAGAVVRSLIPTSTAPPPRTSMSPPSVVATPFAAPADHTANPPPANSGCQR